MECDVSLWCSLKEKKISFRLCPKNYVGWGGWGGGYATAWLVKARLPEVSKHLWLF